MSDFQTVKSSVSLKDYADAKLERVRGGYVCPACDSGKGPSRTPAFSIKHKDISWKCFSCGRGGDVFDLAAIVEGIDPNNKRGQLEAVSSWANIPISEPVQIQTNKNQATKQPTNNQPDTKKQKEPVPDYDTGQQQERDYITRCRKNVSSPECLAYLQERGFTADEIISYGFGYDPNPRQGWKDATGQWHNSGRVIIPWQGCDYYHVDRAIDNKAKDAKYVKPKTEQVGPQPAYNPNAINKPAFFIVEGILDALAIKACGYEAVALMGTDNKETLNRIIKADPKNERPGIVVVMMDNDEPGQAAQREILSTLKDNQVIATGATWGTYKDAGDWFAADREGLRSFLAATYDKSLEIYKETKESLLQEILDRFRTKNPADVAADIFIGKYHENPLPTGISGLDTILNGGLRRGLYVLGALSSLGKTTLALQIADQIAAGGQRPVLFVTIEQSAGELVAKSLNRYLYHLTGKCVPTWQILGDNEQWSLEQFQTLAQVNELYSREVASNLRIMEGTQQPTVEDVRKAAEFMAYYQGLAPVVFIDYLQLLAPHSDRDTDKQSADKNVMALRQLSRDLKTPVFVISSLNRSSYNEGIGQESFKESGAIEYGADVLLGLQAQHLEDTVEAANEKAVKRTVKKFMKKFKAKKSRPCELLVLKNRNGRTDESGIKLLFEAGASLFIEQ